MKKIFLAFCLGCLLLLGGCNSLDEITETEELVEAVPVSNTETELSEGDDILEEEIEVVIDEKYSDYSFELREGRKVVLFFYSDTCQACARWEEELKSVLLDLPDAALVLKVNVDTSKDVVEEFEVMKDSVVVFLDEEGNVLKKLMNPDLAKVFTFFGGVMLNLDEQLEEEDLVYEEKEILDEVVLVDLETEKKNEQEEDLSSVVTFRVGSELVDCVGVAPQKCLMIDDEYFYDEIVGFTYEAGYEYVLRVRKDVIENPPADGSSFSYNLVEIVSKEVSVLREELLEEDEVVLEENIIEKEIQSDLASPRYESYSSSLVTAELGRKYVLYFHAGWCPNCRRLDSEISGLNATLPYGSVIFKTDFDTEIELRATYGVTQQTTLVLIDKDGSHTVKLDAQFSDLRAFFDS